MAAAQEVDTEVRFKKSKRNPGGREKARHDVRIPGEDRRSCASKVGKFALDHLMSIGVPGGLLEPLASC